MACFLGKGHVDVDKWCGFAISDERGSTRMNTVAGLNGGAGWDRRRSCSLSRLYDHLEVSYNGGCRKIDVFIMEHLNLIKMDDLL